MDLAGSPIPCRATSTWQIARFWADALDDYAVAAYDDAELTRLRAAGITDIMDDPTVLVEPSGSAAMASGPRPRLFFQLVPEGSQTVSTIASGKEQHLVSASACRVASTSLPGMTRN
jgi:hypothetical protein